MAGGTCHSFVSGAANSSNVSFLLGGTGSQQSDAKEEVGWELKCIFSSCGHMLAGRELFWAVGTT